MDKKACCGGGLEGNQRASFGTAEYLLRVGESELALAGRSHQRRQQAANKGWLALTTAADAAGLRDVGEPTSSTRSMYNVVRRAAGEDAENEARNVRAALHEACFHNDSEVCTAPYVKYNFDKVRALIRALKRGRQGA